MLTTDKNIYRVKIKNVCTYPAFNTEEQEDALSAIESEIALYLRDVVKSRIIDNDRAYMMRKLTSLLIAGTLRFRSVYSQIEDELAQLGDDFEKYFTREYRILGGLGLTLLCAEKICEELNNNYPTMILGTTKIDSFITSDNPVVFHAKEFYREDYIVDFTDITPALVSDKNTKEVSLELSYKIERIRIPASVLYVPLSSRDLLILIDNKKLQYGIVPDRLMVSEYEVNRLNKHVFGRCMSCTAYGFLDHSLKEDCVTIQSH